MPVYEYLCENCGPFTEVRPMVEFEQPQPCPGCGCSAPRVMLTAPNFSSVSSTARLAHATNERSASSPATLSAMKAQHGGGCSCCSGSFGKKGRKVAKGTGGAKAFPNARPWMISH